MSIILEGIDLAEIGERRRIVIYDNGDVVVKEEGWDEDGCKYYRTSYDAKAIQIPKGHGRLIDADKFIEDLKYDVEMGRTRYITDGDEEAREDAECKENCISFIESSATPTILEAEEDQ